MEKDSDLSIALHPETLYLFEWSQMPCRMEPYGSRMWRLLGLRAIYDYNLRPACVVDAKWIFPKDPFVTYEPSDEDWCRYFGYGHQQERKIDTGEIVLRRDLPIYTLDHEACRPIQWVANSQYIDRVGYDGFTDMDYQHAVRAIEYIHKSIDRYLREKLRKAEERAT